VLGFGLLAEILLFLGAFLLTCCHFYAEASRWKLSYLDSGQQWSRIRDLFFSTALASYLLPFKMGVPLRFALGLRVTRLAMAELSVIMAADAMIALLSWTVISLLVGEASLRELIVGISTIWFEVGIILGALLAVSAVVFSDKLRRAARAFLFFFLGKPKRAFIAFGITVVDVLAYGARHVFLCAAFGFPVSQWPSWAAFGIVATFLGIISGMPMGLVGYDATLFFLYTSVGASPEQVGMVVVSNRTLSFLCAFLLGVPAAHRLGFNGGVYKIWKQLKESAFDN